MRRRQGKHQSQSERDVDRRNQAKEHHPARAADRPEQDDVAQPNERAPLRSSLRARTEPTGVAPSGSVECRSRVCSLAHRLRSLDGGDDRASSQAH